MSFKLASGKSMPKVGFGLWKVPRDKTADTVYGAIKNGYRLFDGAFDYQNEREAGEGIRRAIKDGLVKREDIFITTKLWNTFHSKEHALQIAKEQNEWWGLDYIDLYLIHFPIPMQYIPISEKEWAGWTNATDSGPNPLAKIPTRETWEALEELVDTGIAKSIGVSNFTAQNIYDVQTYNKHPISALQIEHHPYLVQPQLTQLAKDNNIQVTAYSSFGPASFVEIGMDQKVPPLFENETITKIAKAHNKTPSQVLLRWATQRGIAVIPKSNNVERQTQNLESLDFDLTEAEIKEISNLNKNLRFNDPGVYANLPIFA
ncbi:NADP-dependent oxidoreductase domain-containing protein [Yarrowia lipolytica]|jgi:D-xylose reductase|uniref:YALI0D07634p n=2 Tax=Yarrowia lipolytica TaxID=4952 RepID=Q6C9X2_YARLI|nr:YALI0D07634p [Yarrowia lipolytica CLIB122]AOW03739.1 hypothetical protein YALI1_D09870g [Yarrowia lipolytica]KAB8284351.1 NADP-dependent oxidoreductase domain-containing protein [Yarrowia lipolytica]KAE8172674.1 NADP-dependent oxidoreductase domain-containing protein [Yarrowia lipolytica]KAJ8054668.1 NADP-dependent oxidoreductase domain-containing protein [Yarrowia lipolytica]QNP98521.1 Putative NAD(P)H-dependent D-xylose reductase xyl1 [Yarrowia lipolytica]|eukprot:XP_502540.1 YALI0D07634p [Yarrowia lipolytica CLIB122]